MPEISRRMCVYAAISVAWASEQVAAHTIALAGCSVLLAPTGAKNKHVQFVRGEQFNHNLWKQLWGKTTSCLNLYRTCPDPLTICLRLVLSTLAVGDFTKWQIIRVKVCLQINKELLELKTLHWERAGYSLRGCWPLYWDSKRCLAGMVSPLAWPQAPVSKTNWGIKAPLPVECTIWQQSSDTTSKNLLSTPSPSCVIHCLKSDQLPGAVNCSMWVPIYQVKIDWEVVQSP